MDPSKTLVLAVHDAGGMESPDFQVRVRRMRPGWHDRPTATRSHSGLFISFAVLADVVLCSLCMNMHEP